MLPAPGLRCPRCSETYPEGTGLCRKCGAPVPQTQPADTTVTLGRETAAASVDAWTEETPGEEAQGEKKPEKRKREISAYGPGTILAGRYEILALLGFGGMGAVYKAQDRELNRVVALKTIRDDLAGNTRLLEQFKQELLLAREVTHRNVVRLFDLGVHEGVRFITMEFVEGETLTRRMQRQPPLEARETAEIMLQVARALEAAADAGIVHRDLKPDNIMMTAGGRVLVMDFGVALSSLQEQATGTLVGTPKYMSPEQAQGLRLDERSDIFTVGIILYEMLTGVNPFRADSPYSALFKRVKEKAVPVREVNPAIPEALAGIVMKCLATDVEKRYQSATELALTVDFFLDPAKRPPDVAAQRRFWPLVAAGLVVATGLTWTLARRASEPPKRLEPVSVLVSDFENQTGDTVLNGTLEPVFSVALEGASFVNNFNRDSARRLLPAVAPGKTRLDEEAARLVAVREGLGAVVSGSVAAQGSDYVIRVHTVEPATGRVLLAERSVVVPRAKLLSGVSGLAAPVRKALGDSSSEGQLKAESETYTSASLEAAFHYNQAQVHQFNGRFDDAIQEYQRTLSLDPEMGRAYAGLGVLYRNAGNVSEAERYFKLAMEHMDRMSEREKHRTRGGYYQTIHNYAKAIDEFTLLVKSFPGDNAGHGNLALAHLFMRNLPLALAEGREAVRIYPKNVSQRNNVALYALYAGDGATAVKEAAGAMEINPRYGKAYIASALGHLLNGQIAEARAQYVALGKIDERSASLAAIGLADLAAVEGRWAEAIRLLKRGVEADRKRKDRAAAARKQAFLAEALVRLGRTVEALAAADSACDDTAEAELLFSCASTYADLGQRGRVLALSVRIGARLGPEYETATLQIEAMAALQQRPRDAISLLEKAQRILDTWQGRYLLGLAYLQLNAFPEANAEFDNCRKRTGEATSLFFDEVPTFRYFPPLLYHLERTERELKMKGASATRQRFLSFSTGLVVDDPYVLKIRQMEGIGK